MSRRNNKIATRAETAGLVSALSEASGSGSSSAPIYATRGASAALLAKEINKDAQPVATSSIGLGFRSFSPQSIPPAASSNLFLSEDDLPPSNQLEVPQIVIPDTMLPGSSSTMHLSEVMLPLSTMQVNTAYSLLRTLLTFCCETPAFSIPRRRWSSYHLSVIPSATACSCLAARAAITIARSES